MQAQQRPYMHTLARCLCPGGLLPCVSLCEDEHLHVRLCLGGHASIIVAVEHHDADVRPGSGGAAVAHERRAVEAGHACGPPRAALVAGLRV
jgi:hypothetical protein